MIILGPSTLKRNRHTIENDEKTALIKRINRAYIRKDCDRKVRVIHGVPTLTVSSTGERRPPYTLQYLADTLNVPYWTAKSTH